MRLSRAFEHRLEATIATERARSWQTDHQNFFDAYNTKVETEGLLLAEFRQF